VGACIRQGVLEAVGHRAAICARGEQELAPPSVELGVPVDDARALGLREALAHGIETFVEAAGPPADLGEHLVVERKVLRGARLLLPRERDPHLLQTTGDVPAQRLSPSPVEQPLGAVLAQALVGGEDDHLVRSARDLPRGPSEAVHGERVVQRVDAAAHVCERLRPSRARAGCC
jgi:hypothetical protein